MTGPPRRRVRALGATPASRRAGRGAATEAEADRQRSSRQLRVLRGFGAALLRAEDETALLRDTCRVLCEAGDYRVAWVGVVEHDEARSIRLAASWGVEERSLAAAGLTWSDAEAPLGVAVGTGASASVSDLTAEAKHPPWHEEAIRRGCRSTIALPLHVAEEAPFGVLCVFGAAPDLFTSEDAQFLRELAGDLAYGVVTLRARAERQSVEQRVALLSFALDNVREAAFLIDAAGRLCYVNDEACRVLRYTREELLGLHVPDVDPSFPAERWPAHWEEVKTRHAMLFDGHHRTKDGRLVPVEISANYLEHRGTSYVLALVRDITERRRHEAVNASRLHLVQFSQTHSLDELLEETLNEAEKLTGSTLGFYHLMEEDQVTLTRQAWSTRTKAAPCRAEGGREHGPITEAGVWADCVRQRRPVVHNDYPALTDKKGLPPGHAEVRRELVVPVFRGETISAVLGVGNKPTDYDERDVEVISLVASLAREIAERKRVEEALQASARRYAMVFENSPVSIWEEDFSLVQALFDELKASGVDDLEVAFAQRPELLTRCAELVRIEDVNAAALALHGASSKAVLLAGLPQTFTAESFETFREELLALWRGRTEMRRDAVVKTLGGELRYVSVCFAVCPGYEATLSKVLVSLVDISDRHHAEEALRDLNLGLERRVAERTAQLAAANQELEAFVYSVSHDLRAPLRHIDGYLGLLEKRAGSTLGDEGRRLLAQVLDASKRMATLIEDLLSFSRMARHEMSREQVNLDTLVREVIREFEQETKGREVHWRLGALPTVGGDRAMLHAALVNLLSNALKFSRCRTPAVIEVDSLPSRDDEHVVYVRDNGVGFDMRFVDKLFGVFQRLHGTSEFEGTGIGLANVRRIIHRHGGRTWAEGKVDGGATIYLAFPTGPSAAPPSPGTAGTPGARP